MYYMEHLLGGVFTPFRTDGSDMIFILREREKEREREREGESSSHVAVNCFKFKWNEEENSSIKESRSAIKGYYVLALTKTAGEFWMR